MVPLSSNCSKLSMTAWGQFRRNNYNPLAISVRVYLHHNKIINITIWRYTHTWPNDVSRSVELVRSNGSSTQMLINSSLVNSDNKDSAFSKLQSTRCCDISIALSMSVNLWMIAITMILYGNAITYECCLKCIFVYEFYLHYSNLLKIRWCITFKVF